MNPLDEIVLSPAPVLSEECAPVEKIDDEIRALAGQVPLEELYLATFRHVFLNLVERRKRIHPQSIEIWNYYLARSHDAADERKGRKGTA